ncbi:MAG: CRTAC1 family protein [Planctomycetes bacterium]|nr:CRTAC1 family protein [Planctomycetota bacterium]
MSRSIVGAACALLVLGAGSTAQSFVDVSDAAGVSFVPSFYPVTPNPMQSFMAANVSVVDYDGDGWEDMSAFGGDKVPIKLFHNDTDGTFSNRSEQAGVGVSGPFSQQLWGDLDNDGDVDMLMLAHSDQVEASVGAKGPGGGAPTNPGTPLTGGVVSLSDGQHYGAGQYITKYFRNNGDGTFVEKGAEVGLDHAGRTGGCIGDLDKDGWLDVTTCSWAGDHTKFYYNRGDGTFMDRTPANVSGPKIRGFNQHILDYDKDGDFDVLQICDFNDSTLWRHEVGGNVWSQHDHGSLGIGIDQNGMGSAIGDFDNDGWFDWFTAAIYSDVELPGQTGELGNRLYRNNHDGTFSDVTVAAGVQDGGWGWGSVFADLDNDGWQDICHTNGWMVEKYLDDLLRVYMNQQDGTFVEMATVTGIHDPGQGRGLAAFDYDQDGRIDLVVNNRNDGLHLYRNTTPTAGNWLSVLLHDPDANHAGIGATVRLRKHPSDPAEIPNQYRIIEAASHYQSQSPPMAWFGLGQVAQVVVNVDWNDGTVSTHVLAANQRVVLEKPTGP